MALLEPNDPSVRADKAVYTSLVANHLQDVTEIIGSGKVDLGFKAMIHTLAVSQAPAGGNFFANWSRPKLVTTPSCPSEGE